MIYKRHLHTQIYYDLVAFLDVTNTWTSLQTFDGEIHLGINKKIYLDDDKDTYLYCSADGVIDIIREGTLVARIDDVSGQHGIKFQTQKRLGFSHEKSTYIASTTTGNGFIFYADGTKILEAYGSGLFYKKNLTIQSASLLLQELAGTPSASSGYGKLFCLDVAGDTEVFCKDDADNDTQLSAHDKDGFYVHRSTIPKRNLKLQIDIEKFFRKHYPEYVNSEGLELNKNQKVIRIKHLIKKTFIEVTVIGLITLDIVIRLLNPWG